MFGEILICVFFSFINVTATGDYHNVTCRHNVDAKDIITSSSDSQRFRTYSKHSCCAMGLEKESFSFFYNSLTSECQLNSVKVDVSPGGALINEQGWEMYVLKDITCPATYVFDHTVGICYRIYDPNPLFTAYIDYQGSCGNDNAVPFLVDSADKQAAIRSYIEQRPGDFSTFILIQGHRSGTNFVDDNGDALIYTNWDAGQPGAYEMYIGIGKTFHFEWHDITSELSSSHYICEIKI